VACGAAARLKARGCGKRSVKRGIAGRENRLCFSTRGAQVKAWRCQAHVGQRRHRGTAKTMGGDGGSAVTGGVWYVVARAQ
jgi:hypothetical protein